nr:MAG TPA: hypothetical protein [Caudoviricetes sp.]
MAMWIIPSAANEDGGRSNMQTWNGVTPPDGYLWCDEQYVDVYCQAKGFVNFEVDGNTVTNMTVNQEALDKWNTEHPDPVPGDEQIPDDEAVAIIKGEITDAEALKIISGGTENDEK